MSNYTDSVDQSGRKMPVNLRQSGSTPVELLISTRIRKSPYWHLSIEAGCWCFLRPVDSSAGLAVELFNSKITRADRKTRTAEVRLRPRQSRVLIWPDLLTGASFLRPASVNTKENVKIRMNIGEVEEYQEEARGAPQ